MKHAIKKVITMALVAVLLLPQFAHAQSTSDLQDQINTLNQIILNLQTQVDGLKGRNKDLRIENELLKRAIEGKPLENPCIDIDVNLWPGSTDEETGGEVSRLQNYLVEGYIRAYPDKYENLSPEEAKAELVTGYYGNSTKWVVAVIQRVGEVLPEGDPWLGYLGPKTREYLACDKESTLPELPTLPEEPTLPELPPTNPVGEVAGRLSSTVSFVYSDESTSAWLENPGLAFVETWVYFEDDLSPSTIFGLDMELLEGVNDPIHFPGADWMALVGMQRNGTVWIAGGTDATHEGTPSSDRAWQFKSIGKELQPNTWYKFRTLADFGRREFMYFTVQGGDIFSIVDLQGIKTDYPNYAAFDGRTLTHYVWAIDGTAIGGSAEKSSSVYFDDMRYGVYKNGEEIVLHEEDNESYGSSFEELPVTLVDGALPLSNFEEKIWYQERDEALTRPITKAFARSGTKVVEADAEVRDISREEWESE